MPAATVTVTDLHAIAAAAGIPDLTARGAGAKFCRTLGLPANKHQQVRAVLKNGGAVSADVQDAAMTLAAGLKDGSIKLGQAPAVVDIADLPSSPEDDMTDEELLANINKRFRFMRRFVQFAIDGKFASVLITGPGGIGKTYPVEAMLRDADDGERNIRMVSGALSAVKLVEMLWETRHKGDVLLIDDADGGLANIDFLNVLKAATDTKGRRVVSWMKQNKALVEAGVEPQFEYAGSVVIISNANMKEKAEKGNGHIDAILSRAQHLDLGINSSRALALRVSYMIRVEKMFEQMFAIAGLSELHDQAKEAIGSFIMDHRDAFRKLTLREAAKIAKMYIACEGEADWCDMALLSLGKM